MSQEIRNEQEVPPGGFFVAKCDHCGAVFKKHHVDGVVGPFNEHLRANGLPEKTRHQIVQIICRDTPANICEGGNYHFKNRAMSWRDVVNGTRVLTSFLIAGRPLVEQAEANKRAETCAGCLENVTFTSPCSGVCPELESLVSSVVGGAGTPHDHRLMACHVCGCSNRAQIHLPLEILAKGVTKDMDFPPHCWKKPTLEMI